MEVSADVFVGRMTIERGRGVELGQRYLCEWAPAHVDERNAGTVIFDDDGAVVFQAHVDSSTPPGKVLVQRVRHELPDHVYEPASVGGVPDKHARPLTDGADVNVAHLWMLRRVV